MIDEIKMPSRMDAIKKAAKRLSLGRNEWETVNALAVSAAMLIYLAVALVARVLMFALFPLSLVVLYPVIRTNQRRWYRYAKDEEKRRAELVAKLERACDEPIDWPHDWAKPIPSEALYRAARDQEQAELQQAAPKEPQA
jgi:hypothetical protein